MSCSRSGSTAGLGCAASKTGRNGPSAARACPSVSDASKLLVLDAADFSAGPIATVHLPRRVPAMIHGSWIPDRLRSQQA
ncbi:carotenoid oxygenase family protein [Kitasatospora sp. McL0602]|uniref:carotenoid oxygenase family protein n=1 Tax=Kitasatospora sp. McL0602 TaxID=3439530 RepID=UPI003F8CE060